MNRRNGMLKIQEWKKSPRQSQPPPKNQAAWNVKRYFCSCRANVSRTIFHQCFRTSKNKNKHKKNPTPITHSFRSPQGKPYITLTAPSSLFLNYFPPKPKASQGCNVKVISTKKKKKKKMKKEDFILTGFFSFFEAENDSGETRQESLMRKEREPVPE